ncbi:MAG: hypothetical protein ACLTMM_09360 [Lachnospiraceae bacterium]
MKKIFSILLGFVMLAQLLPISALAAGIKSGRPTLTVNQSKVAFAGYEWWVIGDGASGVYPQAGHITLLSAKPDFPKTTFRSGQKNKGEGYSKKYSQYGSVAYYYADNPDGSQWKTPNEYAGSNLHRQITSISERIPAKERELIRERNFAGGGTYDKPSTDGIAGPGVSGQKLWPLSEAEWNTLGDNSIRTYGPYGAIWWLRSPNPKCGYESRVNISVGHFTNNVIHHDEEVRPALSLNLSSVLFTSAAEGGKSTAAAGGNLVAAEAPSGTVKFTMKNGKQKLKLEATTSQSTQTGKTLAFSYDGATTGNNQYISCVLTDNSGAVKYYGKLADSSKTPKGKLLVPLEGVANGDYTLKIFSEEANGDYYTDFCSEPVTMKVNVSNGSGTVSRFGGTLLPAVKLDLYVDGEQFTSEKLSIACGEGTAVYNPDTKTLTLNNATIDNDTMANYAIKTSIPDTLKIRLVGENTIIRTDIGGGAGIRSANAVEISGDGTLAIDVEGDTYDGICVDTDLKISEEATVEINSKGGLGISAEGMVEIDNATVNSTGKYAGIDANGLKITNGANVTLMATYDGCNGAFINKNSEGNGGNIELIASKVKATSFSPGLYAEGKLTINGGEVKCISTADSAIWARGDILIKGGAKVTTEGKYPMGFDGTFTVEEAEVDAKNTSSVNIPAILDVPIIADGYKLAYAKAVDSDEEEIDLLSSGTQHFALYKNVHFITKAAYPVSFTIEPYGLTNVVIKVNGQVVNNPDYLPVGTYPLEVTADNCETYSRDITITGEPIVQTERITMTYLPADYTEVDNAIAKAEALNKDEYKDFTAVEAAINAVVRGKNITEQGEVDAMAEAIEDAIDALVYKDADYTEVDNAITKAEALNKDEYKDFTAVEAAINAVVRGKNITEQGEVNAMAEAIEAAIAALVYKDADYTEVDNAIAKAEALNKDEYKDFTAVEAAINAVVRGKNITEQGEVNAMAKAIEDAIDTLVYKDADYTEADNAIAKAEALNKDEYKDFTAVEAAIAAVVRGKNITEQTEVDAMAKAIEDAIAALVYKDADYTEVDNAIAKAEALNKDEYKDFTAVEAAIAAVVRGKNITEQTEVDAMAKAIEDAIAALVYKDSDNKDSDNKDSDNKDSDNKDSDNKDADNKNANTSLEEKPADVMAKAVNKSPQTGYESNPALWIISVLAGGGAAIGVAVISRRKRHNK